MEVVNHSEDKFEAIESRVRANDNVLTMKMSDLKDAVGAGRLGIYVRERITESLRAKGLGHVGPLPENQWSEVRLYKLGTPVGRLIEAVQTPGTSGDEVILEAVAGERGEAGKLVEEIRKLVCK